MTEIQRRKNRQTGTHIIVLDRGGSTITHANTDPADRERWGDWRWETICEEHGTVCSHESLSLARSFAAAPLDWCEECMAVAA